MELTIDNQKQQILRFKNTKHKLSERIWRDRRFFHEQHEILGVSWDCENANMSRAERCSSYIGVISYFSCEVRHAYMGNRFVLLDGKPVKEWLDEMFLLIEKGTERFEIDFDHMFFIMASWWQCLRHQDYPMCVMGSLREFTENIQLLLQKRSRSQYDLRTDKAARKLLRLPRCHWRPCW